MGDGRSHAWTSCVLAVACAGLTSVGAHAAVPSSSTTALTGTTVHCDSASSEGYPATVEWRVTPPGQPTPVDPDSTDSAIDLTLSTPGIWTIDLDLAYSHLVNDSQWTSHDQATITAKSVVAALAASPSPATTEDTIVLDGSGSQISQFAAASAVFTLDGTAIDGCTFPGPLSDVSVLQCSVPGSDLGAGTFVFSLELTDGVTSTSDIAEQTIDVSAVPPFAISFSWTQSGSNPRTVLMTMALSAGWDFSDLATATWDYGDGSSPDQIDCVNDIFLNHCQYWSHTYASDGYYDVTVTVTTANAHSDAAANEVVAGNPPVLPVAAFTSSPSSPLVNASVYFTFSGSCDGACTYAWDFGDGTASTYQNPVHNFAVPGTYPVRVTVANDGGEDSKTQDVSVNNCWTPPSGILQTGDCYGAPIDLAAPSANAYAWSTGATTTSVTVAAPTTYWVVVDQGSGCWAYVEHKVRLTECQGWPKGNVTMDSHGLVDAADLRALVLELGDGDGSLVIDSWGGEIGAPGADLAGTSAPDPDGLITPDDLADLLATIF